MIWTIISYLIWSVFIFIDAFRESSYKYLRKKTSNIEINVPKLCNIQRGLFLFIIFGFLYSKFGLISIMTIISICLVTPFIYESSYFFIGNKIGFNFPDGICQNINFKDETPSIYLDSKWRKTLALSGFFLQMITCFLR
jgi:hypothetical protein